MILDHAISIAASLQNNSDHDWMDNVVLSNLVECTSGCSFAELEQYCRQAAFTVRQKYSHGDRDDNMDTITNTWYKVHTATRTVQLFFTTIHFTIQLMDILPALRPYT